MVRITFFAFLAYAILIAIGLIPVNNGFENAENGIEIFVYSDNFHSEIFLPIKTVLIDWCDEFGQQYFRKEIGSCTYVAIGWGDRKFFTETPTWNEFKWNTALRAFFWPTDPALHVTYRYEPKRHKFVSKVIVTPEQYQRLVNYVAKHISRDANSNPMHLVDTGYSTHDTFFKAEGSYNFIWTCNAWVGKSLQEAGIRAPLYSPFPRMPNLYLPNEFDPATALSSD